MPLLDEPHRAMKLKVTILNTDGIELYINLFKKNKDCALLFC
jgi:hypothetical protein